MPEFVKVCKLLDREITQPLLAEAKDLPKKLPFKFDNPDTYIMDNLEDLLEAAITAGKAKVL